ncbi:protein involved in transcription initiation from RNA polymerase II promoter [Arthrobacter sp. Hiyo4]|nr:protein involved in transcription initiation from RNA polymerase II promoter [Arthrobacter sp. Hiyo4]
MLERISGSLLDPDALYASNIELFHSPALRGLNLVMGFTGFADAGHVVKQINAELLDTLDAETVAVFDADQLIDYRSRRPTSPLWRITCRTISSRSWRCTS